MSNILIIEDDSTISEVIELILTGEGHTCRIAPSGTEGLEEVRKKEPDIITLDVMLGEDETGIEVCRKIRHEYAQKIGIIVITAKGGGYNEAISLESGCDYFIEKPFDPELLKIYVRNLAARIKRIRNEAIEDASKKVEMEDKAEGKTENKKEGQEEKILTKHFSIDLVRNKISAFNISATEKEKELDMTEQEMKVLAFLIKSGKDLSRKEILVGVWGAAQYNERIVDKQVCSIRGKINKAYGKEMKFIVTKSGYGYRFVDGDE